MIFNLKLSHQLTKNSDNNQWKKKIMIIIIVMICFPQTFINIYAYVIHIT